MSLERNKDSSITIIKNNVVKLTDDKWEVKFQQVVQEYAKLVTACAHTFKETEQYFLEQCDALPLTPNEMRMKSFQLNVTMSHFKDKLEHKTPRVSFDMADEEIEKWDKEESDMPQEAENSSPQQFGLNIHGYYLPHTKRNEVFYEQEYQEVQEFMKLSNQDAKKIKMEDICLFFEETTGDYLFSCGGCSLMYQVIIFMGISEDDIEKHTQRFLGYINAMLKMGYLPDLIEER
jgi:hypothetical protein